jgi:hypothetical protein
MLRFFTDTRSVALIVLVAIGVRLAVGGWFESRLPADKQFEFGDSDGYWYLGQQIATGKAYEYRSPDARIFRMPGYPAMLAPIFAVFGTDASPMWGRGLSALLGGTTAGLCVWWGSELFHLAAGLIAGWIVALYPGAVAMGAFVLSEAPFCPLMVAQLAFWGAAWKVSEGRATILLLVAAGLAGAGAIYMRPSWLLFVPFAAAVGIGLSRQRLTILWHSAVILAVTAMCLAPWVARNYRISNQFVITTLQVGPSLYDGLSPHADGSSNLRYADEFAKALRPDLRDLHRQIVESQINDALLTEAINWATQNPMRVLQLAGIKFLRIWNVIPNEPMFRSWPMKLIVGLTYTPIALLGFYGVWQFSRLGWPYMLCWLPALYFTLLHMIFVASVRYREPAMLGLIVLAAGVMTCRNMSTRTCAI